MGRHSNSKFDILKKLSPNGECWLWTGTKKRGYGSIGIFYKEYKVHRISYEIFIGPIPEGMLVCHSCDTPLCFNPLHLFLGTDQDNTMDAIKKGRADNFGHKKRRQER